MLQEDISKEIIVQLNFEDGIGVNRDDKENRRHHMQSDEHA